MAKAPKEGCVYLGSHLVGTVIMVGGVMVEAKEPVHIASIDRKQREMNAGDQPSFSFLFISGSQPIR